MLGPLPPVENTCSDHQMVIVEPPSPHACLVFYAKVHIVAGYYSSICRDMETRTLHQSDSGICSSHEAIQTVQQAVLRGKSSAGQAFESVNSTQRIADATKVDPLRSQQAGSVRSPRAGPRKSREWSASQKKGRLTMRLMLKDEETSDSPQSTPFIHPNPSAFVKSPMGRGIIVLFSDLVSRCTFCAQC